MRQLQACAANVLSLCCIEQVWAVDLLLYGMLPPDLNVGEAWVNPASWIQLLGFSLLLAGTIIYAQVCLPTPYIALCDPCLINNVLHTSPSVLSKACLTWRFSLLSAA